MRSIVQWGNKKQGFTIVELLIVVVVIAILAAITILAYNGISNRAKASAAASSAGAAAKKVLAYAIGNSDNYPANLADSGITDANGTTYQYRVDNASNPKTYCLTTTSNNVSYYVSSTITTPIAGACAGHGINGVAPVTNLVANPGSESAYLDLRNGGGATVSRTLADKHSGASSTLLTKGSGYAYVSGAGGVSLGVGGETITYSVWVKASTSTVLFARRGSGVSYASTSKAVTPGVWTRISETITIPAGATFFYFDIGWEASTAATGATLYVDDAMATSGTQLYNYADGNSDGWVWNGSQDNSTSTGVAS